MELDEMLKKYSALDEDEAKVEVLPEEAVGVTVEGDSVTTGQDVIQTGGSVKIRVERELRVALEDLPEGVIDEVARELTFKNPLWIRAKRAGTLTPEITRELTCYWEGDGHLFTTRGFASRLIRILQAHRRKGEYDDYTKRSGTVYFEFKGDLYPYQGEVVAVVNSRRFGTICGSIGSGKKVAALYLAAKRQVPVMVIVQTKSQAYQWQEAAGRFLGLSRTDIGLIGDGRQDQGRPFTIAISRALHKMIDDVAESVGFLIVDQCDRVGLNVFFKFVRYIPSAYMLGLAIRRKRDDGLTNLIHAYIGPHLAEIDIDRVYRESTAIRPVFHGQDTGFDYNFSEDYKKMVGALAVDPERNERIVTDVLAETAIKGGARTVVLVERLVHLEALQKTFKANYRDCILISGKTKKDQLPVVFEMFNKGKTQIICVTAKSFNLLNVDRITHLFVASPLRHPENLCQAVGKLLWSKPGDDPPKIFDYRDRPTHLQGSYRGRVRVYRDMGVEV